VNSFYEKTIYNTENNFCAAARTDRCAGDDQGEVCSPLELIEAVGEAQAIQHTAAVRLARETACAFQMQPVRHA
jgi:hypothetical protein